jgi:hypothetical protein
MAETLPLGNTLAAIKTLILFFHHKYTSYYTLQSPSSLTVSVKSVEITGLQIRQLSTQPWLKHKLHCLKKIV